MSVENMSQRPSSFRQLILIGLRVGGVDGRGLAGGLVVNQISVVVTQAWELCNSKGRCSTL